MLFRRVDPVAAAMLAIMVFLGDGSSRAAEQPGPQHRGPTVLVDFRALDTGGQPVLDLKAADLVLRAGGRERPVSSLELIRRGRAATDVSLPPPFASNSAAQSGEGDVFVLVDEASIAPGREPLLRDVLRSFLTRLPPSDRVQLLSLRRGGPALPFEAGLRDVEAALARFAGHSTRSETPNDLVCRSQASLEILLSLFRNYSRSPLPTVVIVSAGFGSPPTGGVSSFGNYGRCPLLQNMDFENVGAAARAINASVYVVHLTDATASPLSRDVLERGVETLAGALGAEVIRGAAPAAASMARIATETSAYYLAGFEAEANDRAGATLPIELRVRRPDIAIRARREIASPQRTPSGSRAAPTPDAMIRTPTSYRDLPLRAAGFASRADTNGKVRLVVLFEPEDPAAKVTAASIGLYDAKNQLTRWTAEPADLARRPLLAGIIVPPGTYRMRVAATASGAAGTVDTEVRAELSDAGAMTMSALLVGVSGPNGFVPQMEFSASDKGAFGYLEIYQVPKNAAVTASLELAATADGPALIGGDVPLTPGPRDDVRVAFSGFSIDGMPAGDVVMRAVVSVGGKPVGRAIRTLRKSK